MIAILPIDRSAVFGTASDLITRRAENRGGKHLRTCSLLLFLASSPLAFGQSADVSPASAPQPNQPSQSHPSAIENREPDELKQELDADAIALSKIPADPLIQPDPVAPILRPVDRLADQQYSISAVEVWRYLHLPEPVRNHYAGRCPARSAQRTPRFHRSMELSTIMEAPPDPSACLFVPEPTLA